MWRSQSGFFLYKMIRVTFLLLIVVQLLTRCYGIHHHMTKEELMSVFQTDHESVPTYQVVPVLHAIHKRSPNAKQEVHLKAFGRNFHLSLEPTQGLLSGEHLSMWTVTRNDSQPNGLDYEKVPEASADIGDAYQDEENMASILLHQDENEKVLVHGNIGSEYVIRPLPERVINEVVSRVKSLHEPHLLPNVTRVKRNLKNTHHHVVFKTSERPLDDEFSDFAYMEPDHLSKKFRKKRSISVRSKRDAPYVIYPEILCIVDYDGYRLHGGDNVQIKRYFVSFWNGVDLRYKLLKGPKIRISIAGIIISRGRDATPYLERNRVGRDAIDSAAALTDMGKYLFRERRLPVYDIAVAVTKLDMCRRQYANDVCNRGTAGFAYVGGACVVNKRLEKVNSVAIIEDTGGFSGIIVAAHEVGHLLGAVHDGSPPPSYLGGPGAEKCRWEDGYIMSDLRHTEKGFKWSHCSVSSFHHFLNGDTATCLYNAPHEDEALPRVLPGKLLSLDAQCRKDRGTSACFKDDRVCAQLFCFDAGSGYCVAYRPAAEGSPCGDGQYCLNGKCVAEHENIIPDYTQNVPTYVRRDNVYNSISQNRPYYSQYGNSTEYRYPSVTTRSNFDNKYKYSTPRTPVNTVSPYKVFSQYTTPVYKKTQSTIWKKPLVKTTRYVSNKIYNSPSVVTTTEKTYIIHNYVKTNYHSTGFPKASYPQSKVTYQKTYPYKYKTSASSMSISSTADGNVTDEGHETEADECKDVATDCAELIDRLRTWLCHLQSVRSRCCLSLKEICKDRDKKTEAGAHHGR